MKIREQDPLDALSISIKKRKLTPSLVGILKELKDNKFLYKQNDLHFITFTIRNKNIVIFLSK